MKSYTEIIVARIKADATEMYEEFERRGFTFTDEVAEDYIDIFSNENIDEMCQWCNNMDEFLQKYNSVDDLN